MVDKYNSYSIKFTCNIEWSRWQYKQKLFKNTHKEYNLKTNAHKNEDTRALQTKIKEIDALTNLPNKSKGKRFEIQN